MSVSLTGCSFIFDGTGVDAAHNVTTATDNQTRVQAQQQHYHRHLHCSGGGKSLWDGQLGDSGTNLRFLASHRLKMRELRFHLVSAVRESGLGTQRGAASGCTQLEGNVIVVRLQKAV